MSYLNEWQSLVLATYDRGEFAYLLQAKDFEDFERSLAKCGDTLLIFIMRELSTKEDCTSTTLAIDRMNLAALQLHIVVHALQQLRTNQTKH